MFILEVRNNIEVETPRGKGRILYITEYGMEIEKLFTVALDESGEIWEFTNRDIRVVSNLTFGRKLPKRSPDFFQQQGSSIPAAKKIKPNSLPSNSNEKKLDREVSITNANYDVPPKPTSINGTSYNGIGINGSEATRPSIH